MGFINSLINNTLQNYYYVKNDFIGFKLDLNFFVSFILNLAISLIILNFTYLFGKKIIKIFKNKFEEKPYSYLISMGIGYITISLGITLLGVAHLLYPQLISIYLLFILFVALYPFKNLIKLFLELFNIIKAEIIYFKKSKGIFIIVGLFLLLGFINLINPEYREDQYHIDLPRQYLKYGTNMIPPKEQLHVSAAPQTAESYYLIGIFLLSKETARFIHFYFYILTLLTLINFSKLNKYKFTIYTPLLLASSPVVIKETSSMYTDFEWLFCILLATLILIDKYKSNNVKYSLAGLFFGGVVASKLWTIIFYPIFCLFIILINKSKRITLKQIFIFVSFSIISYGIWLLRSYLLTGNPLYPAFINHVNLDGSREKLELFQYIGLNYALLNPRYFINVFSPLFFFGMILIFLNLKEIIQKAANLEISKLSMISLISYLLIQYIFGRYMLGLYIFLIFICSLSINEISQKNKLIHKLLLLLSLFVFFYYFINSILIIPYSLGISNKNNYLTRILSKDNSSYYNFGNKFENNIYENDLVAVYNFHGYYYAQFNYIDINFLITKNNRSFNVLKENKINKLLIRGGDIKWFCNNIKLIDCTSEKYKLSTFYNQYPFYYLYIVN